MARTKLVGISIDKDVAGHIRELVKQGSYPSISSAYEAGAEALIERAAVVDAWWEATIRRREEAERHPERL